MLAPAIAGVTHFQTDALIDTDLQAVHTHATHIEQMLLPFEPNSVQLSPDQEQILSQLEDELQRLFLHVGRIGSRVQIVIIGSTDSTGDKTVNLQLSQARADHIRSLLVAAGIPASSLQVRSKETQVLQTAEQTEREKALNRSVTFQVLGPDVRLDERATKGKPTP
jgi:outer membrane protein OmpA-like peptidoglycan-associated protein